MFTALRNRVFRSIAMLYAANAVFEWFATIAVMVLVYAETESTVAAAALLLSKQIVPGLLIPLCGNTLERAPLGRALALTFALQGVLIGLIAFAGYGLWVYPLAGLAGVAGGLVRALLRTGVARTLGGQELADGNAALNIFISIAALLGPALAALLVDLVGVSSTLVVAAVTLMILSTQALSLPRLLPGPDGDSDAAEEPLIEGGSERGQALPLTGLLAVVALITCVFSMDDPALLAFSEVSLGAGVAGYSAIFVAWGLGITIGSVLFTRLTHWPLLRVYVVATVMAGVAYIGMSASPTIAFACAFAVLGGVGNGMDWVAIVTVVQDSAPKGREAWAATRLEAIATAAPGIGILLGGVLAEVSSPRTTILVPGLLALGALAGGGIALRIRSERQAAHSGSTSFVPSIHGGSA